MYAATTESISSGSEAMPTNKEKGTSADGNSSSFQQWLLALWWVERVQRGYQLSLSSTIDGTMCLPSEKPGVSIPGSPSPSRRSKT